MRENIVERAALFLETTSSGSRTRRPAWLKELLVFAAILAIAFAGLGVAYLIVAGQWQIAIIVVFFIPAIFVLHKMPFIALPIWLLLSPFLVQTPSEAERQIYWLIHRLLPVATLGMMMISSSLRITERRLPRLTVAEYGMIGYIAATLLSIILQNNSVITTLIYFYDHVFGPMCLYWVVKFSMPGERSLKWLFPVAIFITVSQVAIGVISWFMPSILPSDWLGYAGARTTGSLNSVSVYTVTVIFSGLYILFTAQTMRPGWKKNLLILLYLSTLYAVFISYSRASWLAGVLVVMGVVYLYPRFMFRLGMLLLPFGLIGVIVLSSHLQYAKDRFLSSDSTQTALSRLPVVVAAYRMFEAKPIFGWGYENFDRYDRQFQGRFGELVNPDEKDLTSHNVYLTTLAEQGIVGFFLLMLPVFWLLYRSIKVHPYLSRRGYRGSKMLFLFWMMILSFIIVNNLAPMVVFFGLGLYWIILGLIANTIQNKEMIR